MRPAPVNKLRLAVHDVLDTAVDGLVPRRGDLSLGRVDVAVHTEQKLVSRLEALVRVERLAGLE